MTRVAGPKVGSVHVAEIGAAAGAAAATAADVRC